MLLTCQNEAILYKKHSFDIWLKYTITVSLAHRFSSNLISETIKQVTCNNLGLNVKIWSRLANDPITIDPWSWERDSPGSVVPRASCPLLYYHPYYKTITNRHVIHPTSTTNNVANEKGKMKGEKALHVSNIFIFLSLSASFFSLALWCKRWVSTTNDLLNQASFPQFLRQTGTRQKCL